MKLSRVVYAAFGKRMLDIVISALALILISPIMVVVFFLVRRELGKPVFYRHRRPSKDGKPFILYKFRTMTDARGSDGKLLHDDERLTKLGKFLRSTSIDELPEFWNVLKGEMSLVGPRPLLMEYLDRYTPEQARRHEVKTGVTGWAQVNGRNAIRFAERFKLDVWYVDNMSFWLDVKILLMTVRKIILREGIDQQGGKMEVFKGTKA